MTLKTALGFNTYPHKCLFLPTLTTILWNESRDFMTHMIVLLNVKEDSNLKISGHTF